MGGCEKKQKNAIKKTRLSSERFQAGFVAPRGIEPLFPG